MHKILIIGSSGTGKSTLALELGEILNLPVHHLDIYFWKPNWVQNDREQFDAALTEILKKEKWIIDGDYGRTMEWRLRFADTVIFLDYPTRIALYRAFKRRITYRNKTRPSITKGCNEKIDWEFIKWIWNFRRNHRQKTLELLEKNKHIQVIRFNTPKKLVNWLKNVRDSKSGAQL